MDLQANILFKDVVADTDPEDVRYRLQCQVNEWFFPEITSTMPEVHVSPFLAPPAPSPAPLSVPLPPVPLSPLVEPPVKFGIPDRTRTHSAKHLFSRVKRGDRRGPLPQSEQPALNKDKRPLFVVSDLHLGDRGPRDNFAHMNDDMRMGEFWAFLSMVERENGQLIITGDLFELWQSNMSLVLTSWYRLLDRLAKMKAIYILGNHDADLLHFCSSSSQWLSHPFFKTMTTSHTEHLGGRNICFIHGHEMDSYCVGSVPGIGRITAIYTGLKEDRNGSPLLNKYRTVEAAATGRLEWVSGIVRWFLRRPNRTQAGHLGLCKLLNKFDVVVSGHTHIAGQLYQSRIAGGPSGGGFNCRDEQPLPIYNAGTWAETTCSYVVVSPDGEVGVFDWIDCQGVPNTTKLKVK